MGIIKDPNGLKRVTCKGPDGKRVAVRLGKASLDTAEQFDRQLNALSLAVRTSTAIPHRTAEWLAALSDEYHDRISRLGLTAPRIKREAVALGVMLDAFVDNLRKRTGTSQSYHDRVRRTLLEMFGADTDPASITPEDAERWRAKMADDEYAQATISKDVKVARQAWRWAIRMGYATENPFADVVPGSMNNPERSEFVRREVIDKVIEYAPDSRWRLLIALSRYGGVRIPSEAVGMLWKDVDFAAGKVWIRSTKNRNHGNGGRWIPMFPELRTRFMDAFESASDGAVQVFEGTRWTSATNLRTQFQRMIQAAGFQPWPRLFHNLRASRQTELASEYPLATACAWIGNTRAVASGHYLQQTDSDWLKATGGAAARNAAQGGAECGALPAQNAAHRMAPPDTVEQREGAQTHTRQRSTASGGAVRRSTKNRVMAPLGFEPRTERL